MNITTDTPDLLILRFTRWKGPLAWTLATFGGLWVGVVIAADPDLSLGVLLLWLLLSVAWTLPIALFRMEKSMLVLNRATGMAELRHRDIRGLHRHTWPLSEVQSTRITRRHSNGSAIDDLKRHITLYVREGMDEGRHKLTNYAVPAEHALAASSRVSDWMKDWRRSLDSGPAQS